MAVFHPFNRFCVVKEDARAIATWYSLAHG